MIQDILSSFNSFIENFDTRAESYTKENKKKRILGARRSQKVNVEGITLSSVHQTRIPTLR